MIQLGSNKRIQGERLISITDPCKGTQQGTSEKFNGDQLCYGLSDLDLMVVDFHLNLCRGTQLGSSEKFDGDELCYGLSNLDLMVE